VLFRSISLEAVAVWDREADDRKCMVLSGYENLK
jgi:hypothetical protein